MKLQGEHRFGSSRTDVWHALQDPQTLADSLPGVRRFEVAGEDRYKVTVTVGVGAIKGSYAGMFSLQEKRELESCRVVAEASGPPGSLSTTAEMRLTDLDGGGTLLAYEAQATVTGPLAGVGQRMIEAAARKTTREFLEALERGLLATEAEAGAEGATTEVGLAPVERRPPLPAQGSVFVPSPRASSDDARDLRLFIGGALTGFVMAILGVLIGRRTAHR